MAAAAVSRYGWGTMRDDVRLYRAREMKRADELAGEAGIAVSRLMEAAGEAVASAARRHFPAARRILLLCGKGNNGGDGYVAARRLLESGLAVTVLELPGERVGEPAMVRRRLLEVQPPETLDEPALLHALGNCDLVIDALFGSGLSRPLEGEVARAVELVNASDRPVLAVDVPSGLSSDSPVPPGAHLAASRTVQLAGAKLSSAFEPARSAYGELEVADIGIPREILEQVSRVKLLGGRVAAALPQRAAEAHKYQVGTVLVLAGSPYYLGAAELACRGAYRAGAGLVTLAAQARLPVSWPEIIFWETHWDHDPVERLEAIGERRAQAIVAGPGLDERALGHLPRLLARRRVPWVLDAGALAPLAELREAVREHGGCVLTPHAGEAAKLLGVDAAEVVGDPVAAAERLASEWNAVCVLKGRGTVIAGDGSLAVSIEGHEGMATGGTGDVLAGVVGAFLAAPGGAGATSRTEAAVVLHGVAGRLAGEQLGAGMVASDLVAKLPLAWRLLAGEVTGGA